MNRRIKTAFRIWNAVFLRQPRTDERAGWQRFFRQMQMQISKVCCKSIEEFAFA